MELIDIQDAIRAIDDVLMEDDQYKVWLKLSINNLKTVDAIPVEWIEKHISEIEDFLPNVAGAFKGLVEIWRAEQEKQNENNRTH